MTIRTLCVGGVSALLFAESAWALSCMRPELSKTMETAKASDTVYSILVGTFETPPTSQMQQRPQDIRGPENQFTPRPPVITPAKFSGYALTSKPRTDVKLIGFPLDIETSCMGPWCSSVPEAGRENIVFVEMRPNQSPVLKISACPQWVFPLRTFDNQEANSVKSLRKCFDETCQRRKVDGKVP